MDRITPISEVRAHLPEIVRALRKRRREHIIITRGGHPSAVLVSPEEMETLEILADKRLMLSLLKAETDEQAGRLVTHEDVFK